MSSVKQLEQELATAKAAELEKQKEKLKEQFEHLFGKCFARIGFKNKKEKWLQLTKFAKDGTVENSHDGNLVFKLKSEAVTLSCIDSPYIVNEGILLVKQNHETYKSPWDANQDSVEVSEDAFQSAKKFVSSIARATFQEWLKLVPAVEANLKQLAEKEGKKPEIFGWDSGVPADLYELDINHVKLEPYEASVLSGAPFFLHDYTYLLTPNSIAWGKAKIELDEQADFRCAGLYEACDMAHVERSRKTRAELRRKLGIK